MTNARGRSAEHDELPDFGVQPSLSDVVIKRVRENIQQGRYVPGQRLYEKDLIDELGIGRGSVREALRLLVADGIVEIIPHRGATIRQFTRDEVWALHEIREVLEGLAASLAASRAKSASDHAGLLDLEQKINAAIAGDDRDEYSRLNSLLHTTIVSISGNPCLQGMIDRSHATALRLQTARFLDRDQMAQRRDEHKAIVDAIIAGDPATAESTMREHVRNSRRILLKLPDFVFTQEKTR